ncbi:MurR/RpiR family transcriptional regulator [Bosea sp. R86505]|uniref:MurR/RpiR family transcriptional regulator n=1 Tax=Bosea sp. R86505 TaxID=3101710 RepID=UPI00366C6E0A
MKISLHVQNGGSGASDVAFAASELGQKLLALQAAGSASNRMIAEHLLRNPVRGAALSIEDLAAASGVSTATLSRFARSLGFGGFPDLRAALADTLQAVLRPVEKLRGALDRAAGAAPLREGLEDTLANLRATAEGLEPAALQRIVARLVAARCVYVMGFGLSAHLAGLMTLGLQPFCQQLVNVVEFGGTENAAGRLMNLGAEDVLIAISFPRYATDAVHLTRYAADRGAAIVALTDSAASPLAPLAGETLIAQSAHPVLSSSNVAALLVIEALVTALMVSNADNVTKAARLTEAISAYLVSQPMRGR